MAKYHGKGGVVYISLTGTGDATSIVGLTNWSLNAPTDKVETTEFGAANKTYVIGIPDFAGALSGWWNDTSDTLYDASRSADGVKMYLYPSSLVVAKYWYGPAWVDFNIETNTAGAVAVNGDYVANGAWGQM